MVKTTPIASKINYQALSEELETILNELQSDNLDISKALSSYERGLVIIKQLEDYIKRAENSITTINSLKTSKKSVK